MGAIKRNPTPPGPITDLFDRLHEIHLLAGLPSVRDIARGIGRGVISSSTTHNMFRGPRVPRLNFLELVVEELHGDTAEFRTRLSSQKACSGYIQKIFPCATQASRAGLQSWKLFVPTYLAFTEITR